jgi:lysozyme family protein
MTAKFDKCVAHILKAEGGYVNDPRDPGGETKYGISKRAYPEVDIASLTLDQAKAIYERDYWNPVQGDEVAWPLCLFVFDSAVNQGTHAAIRMMQKALGTSDDGILGPETLRLAAVARQWHAAKFMALRARRYATTANADAFGEGWLIRLFTIAMEAD